MADMLHGSGLVRYSNYRTDGVARRKGMRNCRSKHREEAKRRAIRARMARQSKEDDYYNDEE
jgi:hypothetical protein